MEAHEWIGSFLVLVILAVSVYALVWVLEGLNIFLDSAFPGYLYEVVSWVVFVLAVGFAAFLIVSNAPGGD